MPSPTTTTLQRQHQLANSFMVGECLLMQREHSVGSEDTKWPSPHLDMDKPFVRFTYPVAVRGFMWERGILYLFLISLELKTCHPVVGEIVREDVVIGK